MKSILKYMFFIWIVSLTSCIHKDEEYAPLINYLESPELISSIEDGDFILFEEDAADTLFELSWNQADFGYDAAISYVVELDELGNDFSNSLEILNDNTFSMTLTVQSLNEFLTIMGIDPYVKKDMELRVSGVVGDAAQRQSSNVISFKVVPYKLKLAPIYMLGSGTVVGWDNVNPVEVPHLYDKVYGTVSTFIPNEWYKFIRDPGTWAPMWGSDGTGNNVSGILQYRATDADSDPASIPTPDTEGDYRVLVDIQNMTYAVYPIPETVYLSLGNSSSDLFTFNRTDVGIYELEIDFDGSSVGWNIYAGTSLEEVPFWGTDENGSYNWGQLVYSENAEGTQPLSITSPEQAGTYLVTINFIENTYTVILK
ncbi:SusE domain-containing protein [uncultured Draconibacterium sp.]|uniref:SusE domain-containing protein n=1 Tax=uncultured Draconibacterium sp. TaxID=1573823 RepID=UPI0029C74592|nr:SusE domain-containing protein [uncultured Draconibacterium sp.]